MNSKLILLLTIGLAGLALNVGCGGDSDAPASKSAPSSAKTTGDNERTTAPGETSSPDQPTAPIAGLTEQLRETIEIPAYYPEDGPIYPGAKPSQSQQAPNGRVSLVFGTDEMPDEASSVMNEAAEAKGWTILSEDRMERGLLTQAEKGNRKLMILTSRMDGGSSDAVTLVAVSVDP